MLFAVASEVPQQTASQFGSGTAIAIASAITLPATQQSLHFRNDLPKGTTAKYVRLTFQKLWVRLAVRFELKKGSGLVPRSGPQPVRDFDS